jgi:hypothetical protein
MGECHEIIGIDLQSLIKGPERFYRTAYLHIRQPQCVPVDDMVGR